MRLLILFATLCFLLINADHSHGYDEKNKYGEYSKDSFDYSYSKTNYKQESPFSFGKHHSFDTHYCSVHGSFALAMPSDNEYGEYGGEYSNSKSSSPGYGSYAGNRQKRGAFYESKEYERGDGQKSYGEYEEKDPSSRYSSGNYESRKGARRYDDGYRPGKKDDYGKRPKYVTRHYTRQFCRYAASKSNKACSFCCKVVARSSNTSPEDIVAAIFVFNPFNPAANGAGIGHSYTHGDTKYEGKYEMGNHGPTGAVDKQSYNSASTNESSGYKSYNEENSAVSQCVCCAPKFKY